MAAAARSQLAQSLLHQAIAGDIESGDQLIVVPVPGNSIAGKTLAAAGAKIVPVNLDAASW